MMPQALETLGSLTWGQIYGFAPALSLGGRNILKNLQKMPLVEHLVFLASMELPTYYDYTPPDEGESGFGTVTPRRTIGPQRCLDRGRLGCQQRPSWIEARAEKPGKLCELT